MALQFRPMADAKPKGGESLMLWSFDEGGWNHGAWHEGRWVDFLTLSVELLPIYWDEVPPDPPAEMLRMPIPERGAHLSLDAPAFEDGKTTIGDQIQSDAFRF